MDMSSAEAFDTEVVSVSEAEIRGVPALVREAGQGHDVVVARDGRPVAAIISIGKLVRLRELENDLRNATLVLTRAMTDEGSRHDLDDVIARLGFDRSELETEVTADVAAHLKRPRGRGTPATLTGPGEGGL